MAGFVIDIFVAYFVRAASLLFQSIRSRRWPATQGTVLHSRLHKPGFGCSYVEIRYSYKTANQRSTGTRNQPLLFGSGNDYVSWYQPGKPITIRYKANDPSVSLMIPD